MRSDFAFDRCHEVWRLQSMPLTFVWWWVSESSLDTNPFIVTTFLHREVWKHKLRYKETILLRKFTTRKTQISLFGCQAYLNRININALWHLFCQFSMYYINTQSYNNNFSFTKRLYENLLFNFRWAPKTILRPTRVNQFLLVWTVVLTSRNWLTWVGRRSRKFYANNFGALKQQFNTRHHPKRLNHGSGQTN